MRRGVSINETRSKLILTLFRLAADQDDSPDASYSNIYTSSPDSPIYLFFYFFCSRRFFVSETRTYFSRSHFFFKAISPVYNHRLFTRYRSFVRRSYAFEFYFLFCSVGRLYTIGVFFIYTIWYIRRSVLSFVGQRTILGRPILYNRFMRGVCIGFSEKRTFVRCRVIWIQTVAHRHEAASTTDWSKIKHSKNFGASLQQIYYWAKYKPDREIIKHLVSAQLYYYIIMPRRRIQY